MIIFLDTNILGKLANPNQIEEALKCRKWFEKLLVRGVYFVSSELCFYEVKRSLILALKKGGTDRGIKKLEELRLFVDVLAVDQQISDLSAEIWAETKLKGIPTANQENIDIEIIIAAHWQALKQEFPGRYIIVSTTNIKHLDLLTDAREWQDINF
jgi:predicted nucleic acid-binding protein